MGLILVRVNSFRIKKFIYISSFIISASAYGLIITSNNIENISIYLGIILALRLYGFWCIDMVDSYYPVEISRLGPAMTVQS